MPKTLIVVEGPAGSGKSYLINKLRQDLGVIPARSRYVIDRPRNYGHGAATLSQIKDQLHLLAAIDSSKYGQVVALDRWAISQWVYEQIRTIDDQEPTEQYAQQALTHLRFYMNHMLMSIQNTAVEYSLRKQIIPTPITRDVTGWLSSPIHFYPFDQIVFLFNLPQVDLIEDYRRQADRPFPFSAHTERRWYSRAAGALHQVEFVSIPIRPVIITLSYRQDNFDIGYDELTNSLFKLLGV